MVTSRAAALRSRSTRRSLFGAALIATVAVASAAGCRPEVDMAPDDDPNSGRGGMGTGGQTGSGGSGTGGSSAGTATTGGGAGIGGSLPGSGGAGVGGSVTSGGAGTGG